MTGVRNRAWLWGGVAVIASAIAEFAFPTYLSGRGLISALLLAAGLMLFAFGGGIRHNIFGGQMLGAVAAVLLAALLITTRIIGLTPDAGGPAWNQLWVGSVVGFARLALTFVLVVQVGRSRSLPGLWRWAPLWAVVFELVSWVITQVVLINAGTTQGGLAFWVMSWAGVIAASTTIFIGVLAILVAHRFNGPAHTTAAAN